MRLQGTFIAALQIASAPIAPETRDLDISQLKPLPPGANDPATPCATAQGDEIIVCGRRTGPGQRIEPLDPKNDFHFDNQVTLGKNMVGSAEVEAGGMDRGVTANRVMVRVKIGF